MSLCSIDHCRLGRPHHIPAQVEALHFVDAVTYRTWAHAVDSEAPGLPARLLTLYRISGDVDVLFRLPDETPLVPDGVDVLHDITRRLGLHVRDRRPPPKSGGGRPRPGDRPNSRYSLPVSTRSLPPCQLLA
jgi:hypothetical protein